MNVLSNEQAELILKVIDKVLAIIDNKNDWTLDQRRAQRKLVGAVSVFVADDLDGKNTSSNFSEFKKLNNLEWRAEYDPWSIFEALKIDYGKTPNANEGTLMLPDGRYEGEIVGGMANGNGVFYRNDKRMYKGTFLNNQAHGNGTVYLPDGTRCTGTWNKGQRDQPVTCYFPDGRVEQRRDVP